mgnify:CR=1 FL=1|tara:strand:- start:63480 stop:65168 length:1689 start_codon:yes stop_codon:yes gene_type:complete
MKVWVRGEGAVSLTKRDYVGQGGQGAIYAKGGSAFKIFSDVSSVPCEGKVRELSALDDPNVIRPQKLVCDKDGAPLGYTMRFVRDAYALCQLFPRSFRERNRVTADQIARLIKQFRQGLSRIHKTGILVVDLNEMNFLVDKAISELFFIDVDSYQTRSYPADAIMESIRDRHAPANAFSELTDWFSFAIVSFQMFTGIHPFKGKHPQLKGLDARMKANVSVLNPDVRVPKAAYPFGVIPAPMLNWYEAVFEKGQRIPPPDVTGRSAFVPAVRTVIGSGALRIAELSSFDATVQSVWAHGDSMVVSTQAGLWLNGRRVGEGAQGVAFSARANQAVAVSQVGEGLALRNLVTREDIDFGLHGHDVTSYDGRVYFRSRDKIMELVLAESGNRIVAGSAVVATVLPNATQLFSGVAIQSLLGATYVSVFPRAGVTHQLHIAELDGYRVLSAAFDSGVLMVMARPRAASKQHQFDRLILRFDEAYKEYDVRIVKDVAHTGLNFVVLDTRVCVSVTEEDRIEAFHASRGAMAVKVVDDDAIGGDIGLAKRSGQLLFSRGSSLYSMSLT